MVNYTEISDTALKEMREASATRFQHITRYGAEAGLTAKATTAAEGAVAKALAGNANATPEELTNIADKAFRRTFSREATSLLAGKGGHIGATLTNAGRNIGNGVAEGARQIFGRTKGADGEIVAKAPGRIAKSFTWLPDKIGNVVKNNPRLAFVGVGLGAVYGGAKLLEGRNEAKQQAEYEANMQQVAAMQAAAAQQGGARGGYYGSVSAEEAAAMDAQMRTGGQNGGFAAAEMQRRAAAAAVEQGPAA